MFVASEDSYHYDIDSEDEEFLETLNGKKDKKKTVVEQPRNLVILEADNGFLFHGEFSHGGSPVVDIAGEHSRTWLEVQSLFVPLYRKQNTKDEKEFARIFKSLTNIALLDKITRLHVSIFPKGVDFVMPEDTVGYSTGKSDDA